jgi:cysteine-rich repeat protein
MTSINMVIYLQTNIHIGCDDGNVISGDGCSSTCAIEAGWNCGYGNYYEADICWPLNRPMITSAAISTDNTIIDVSLNGTAIAARKS